MAMKLPKLQFKQQGSNSVFRPGTWNRPSLLLAHQCLPSSVSRDFVTNRRTATSP